ncbi:hypothetical protein ACWCXH_39320 [Kitasatospora sp. NPDC001660]
MNRLTRLCAVAATGLTVALAAGCGDGGSSVAAQPATPVGAAAKPSVQPGPPSGTITLSENHGAYTFGPATCTGDRSSSGKLSVTANARDTSANTYVSLDIVNGWATLELTVGGAGGPVLWRSQTAISAMVSRTPDTVTFNGMPMKSNGTAGVTASGSLTCTW